MPALAALAAHIILFQCPGGLSTTPTAINNTGTITGYCNGNGFIRHPNGTFTLFNTGLPTAINAHGDTTGYYSTGVQNTYTNTLIYNGFIRLASGAVTTFSANGPNFPTFANGINAAGIVVGDWVDGTNHPQGFVRHADGTFANLDLYKMTPYAINDAGQFAGSWYDIADKPHGFTMHITDQTFTNLPMDLYSQQLATAINSAGNVTGFETTVITPVQSQAFLTSPKLTFFNLPTIEQLSFAQYPKTKLAYGGGINTHNAATIENQYRAPDGTITTIDLGPCINVTAQGINDAGQVTGTCTQNNQSYGFIWQKLQKQPHLITEVER